MSNYYKHTDCEIFKTFIVLFLLDDTDSPIIFAQSFEGESENPRISYCPFCGKKLE